MSELSPVQILLEDPLGQVTRKERRNLLAAAAIALSMAKIGLVPTKITALGIEFSPAERSRVLLVLAAIVGYFLTTFIVYAISDLVAWRARYHRAAAQLFVERRMTDYGPTRGPHRAIAVHDSDDMRKAFEEGLREEYFAQRRLFYGYAAKPIAVVRPVFDFAFPIVLSIYAMVVLILYA